MGGKNERGSIAPRIRAGEVKPFIPANRQLTRVHGYLILVTRRHARHPMFGQSKFTVKQVEEINKFMDENGLPRRSAEKPSSAW